MQPLEVLDALLGGHQLGGEGLGGLRLGDVEVVELDPDVGPPQSRVELWHQDFRCTRQGSEAHQTPWRVA